MANDKPKVPKPPRPVQAPKQRHGGSKKPGGGIERRWLYVGAGVLGVVIAAVVLAVVLSGGSSGGGSTSTQPTNTLLALKQAGCTYQTADVGRQSIHTGTPDVTVKYDEKLAVPSWNANTKVVVYNTIPPSGGPHYDRWVPWGLYQTPFLPVQGVHNLEHGGLVIQYGPKVPQSSIAGITTFYNNDPDGLLVAPFPAGAPYTALGSRISLASWTSKPGGVGTGHLALCPRYDEAAFQAFEDSFSFKGPEGFPRSSLSPGT